MYSCHSVLERYNLFSGVKLSIRSFCFIFKVFQEFVSSEYIFISFPRVEQVIRRHERNRKSYAVPSDFYFPWPEVIEQCIGFILTTLQNPSTGRDSSPYTRRVHFFQDELRKFYPPESWQTAISLSKSELSLVIDDSSL